MKINIFRITLLAITALAGTSASAQKTRFLTPRESQKLEQEHIAGPFPVFRAFEYADNGGLYNLLLCEKKRMRKGTDTLNNEIAAVCYLQDHGGYLEQWSIKDQIDTEYNETSIWFWTKYSTATDLDGDKLIDPVIVYGTKDADDQYRRIKVITIYKGKKIAIRAVESDLDYGRSFKKDKTFALLPAKIKIYLEKLLSRIRTAQGILLKDG